MKAVKNTPVKIVKNIEPHREYNYWCKYCGEAEQGIAHYRETNYGTVHLIDLDGAFQDYETQDTDNFEINYYRCEACGEEKDCVEDLFTTDDPDRVLVFEDDEDDEGENEE